MHVKLIAYNVIFILKELFANCIQKAGKEVCVYCVAISVARGSFAEVQKGLSIWLHIPEHSE